MSQAQEGTGPGSARQGARAGGQCAKDSATARGKKINLIIAVARAGEGQQIPRPSPMVPSWHKKKEKGRFGVGAGLRGQIPDRPPILKGLVGHLGFLVNSETRHRESRCLATIWAFLLIRSCER